MYVISQLTKRCGIGNSEEQQKSTLGACEIPRFPRLKLLALVNQISGLPRERFIAAPLCTVGQYLRRSTAGDLVSDDHVLQMIQSNIRDRKENTESHCSD
jgi:hypothetical protein